LLSYLGNGEKIVTLRRDPTAVTSATGKPVDLVAGEDEYGMPVPGEIIQFDVKVFVAIFRDYVQRCVLRRSSG